MSDIKYPSTKEEKARIYLGVMLEIKSRLSVIYTIEADGVHEMIPIEIGYLQLRHICELITIGCLTAQGDFQTFRQFKEEYRPKEIFKALEKIHPHFFPQPVSVNQEGNVINISANSVLGAITREELENIWEKSGNFLHRLTMKRFLKNKQNVIKDRSFLLDCVRRVNLLLNNHWIDIVKSDVKILTFLNPIYAQVEVNFLTYKNDGTMHVDKFNVK
jgi:hypothetical protein